MNNRHISLCAGLAILPIDKIDDGWKYILNESPSNQYIKKFNQYMQKNWINELRTLWSCEEEQYRTTNFAEGWNSKLKRYIGRSYPTFTHLLTVLHEDAKFYGVTRSRCNTHFTAKKRSLSVIENNDRINRSVLQLKHKNITVGHCLEKICPYIWK